MVMSLFVKRLTSMVMLRQFNKQKVELVFFFPSLLQLSINIYRVGQNHKCTVYVQYFGREMTKYTVIYGAYIRFWPTLQIYYHPAHTALQHTQSFRPVRCTMYGTVRLLLYAS